MGYTISDDPITRPPQQLALPIGMAGGARLETYFVGPNQELIRCLEAIAGEETGPYVYLWGGPGLGKTHLLQALCQRATEAGLSTAYVPLRFHAGMSMRMLEGLERVSLVCIDDVDSIAGLPEWESALFACYNRIRDNNKPLVIAGRNAPATLPVQLPDLLSRLAWGLTYQLHTLDDAGKLAALRLRARYRGFELPVTVGRYMLQHYPRDMHTLFTLLDQLDNASLAAQRHITIPFIRRVLMRDSGDS